DFHLDVLRRGLRLYHAPAGAGDRRELVYGVSIGFHGHDLLSIIGLLDVPGLAALAALRAAFRRRWVSCRPPHAFGVLRFPGYGTPHAHPCARRASRLSL